MTKLPTAPRDGTELRRQLIEQFKLQSAAALIILATASAALDEAIKAEALVAKEGLVVTTQRGPKPHPAIHIAQQARHRMIRALRSLNLEI